MSEVKAIETWYRGFRFRSRLEARWAVFFDAMKWDWRYEPQGYEFSGERYLPDFWVPQLLSWVEVKGAIDTDGMRRLASAAKHLPNTPDGETLPRLRPTRPKLLILGDVPEPGPTWAHVRLGVDALQAPVWQYAWFCVTGMFPFSDWSYVEDADLHRLAAWFSGCSAKWIKPMATVSEAYTAARSARFEHGEKGAA